jgi:hypothetical protein
MDKARSAFGSIKMLTERHIPLPSALAEQPAVIRLIRDRVIQLTERGSRHLWTARIWELRA